MPDVTGTHLVQSVYITLCDLFVWCIVLFVMSSLLVRCAALA